MFQSNFHVGDSHANQNRHQHLHDVLKRQDTTVINGQVVSVVYVTAVPTFTGVLGGGATASSVSPSSSARSTGTAAVATQARASTSFSTNDGDVSESSSSQPSASNIFSQIIAGQASSTSISGQTTNVAPTISATTSRAVSYSMGPSSTSSSSSSSSSDIPSSAADSGMSNAGKAGLATGVILAIGVVLGIILFLLSKKKKQVKADKAREDSEKNSEISAASRPGPNAPRLSLRPASSFLPEFMGGNRPKSRLSQGNMLGAQNNEPNPTREKYLAAPVSQNIQMTEKPAPEENPFKDPENPFADPIRSTPAPAPLAMPEPERSNGPIYMPEPLRAPIPMPSPRPDDISEKIAVSSASAGAAATVNTALRAHNQPRHITRPENGVQEPIEMPSPPIPAPAPLSTQRSNVVSTQDGNVYRILMDFNPSMEDELDLKAGNVVRMLHEYDDGWCLCARLDKSQQGAVPRTCLAAKPSKPRPANGQRPMSPAMGPPGPHSRPMSPAMRTGPPRQQGPPMSPSMGRPMSPGMGRPMSPGMGRSMSPGPSGRAPMGRSMSPGPRNGQSRVASGVNQGAYNQPPRPLSPGPRSSKRSMSPGPYGPASGPAPMAPNQRRRSNSSSQTAREVRDRRQSPPGPSPLNVTAVPGMAI